MRKIKAIFAIFTACALFAIAPACNAGNTSSDDHIHEWSNYLVKTPSCEEAGSLEKNCNKCGKKEYETINPTGHNIQDGVCTICNAQLSITPVIDPIPMPENANNAAAWSFEKIYNTASTYYSENYTYSEFIKVLSYGALTGIYTDNLGFLHLTANFTTTKNVEMSLPLILSVNKVSPINPKENKFSYIANVKVANSALILRYSDGLQVSAGKLEGSDVTITSFGLNTNNELVIYYSNNTIAFAGKIPEGKAAETQADFIYQAVNGGYEVYKVLNLNKESVIKIPVSHQGKPIVSISDYAFASVASNAQAIVIPSSVTIISSYAFSGLKNSTRLYFESARGTISTPSSLTAYFAGEWSYVNGAPTPNS